MTYELLDSETGNLVGSYSSEEAALDACTRALARNGTGYVASLALAVEDDEGNSSVIDRGGRLVARATPPSQSLRRRIS
jgi:hypothetical protein